MALTLELISTKACWLLISCTVPSPMFPFTIIYSIRIIKEAQKYLPQVYLIFAITSSTVLQPTVRGLGSPHSATMSKIIISEAKRMQWFLSTMLKSSPTLVITYGNSIFKSGNMLEMLARRSTQCQTSQL